MGQLDNKNCITVFHKIIKYFYHNNCHVKLYINTEQLNITNKSKYYIIIKYIE